MRKKILILIPGSPFPPINGHKLKIFNLIKILSKSYDLILVTISTTKLTSEEIEFVNQYSIKNFHFKLNLFSSISHSLFNFIFKFKPLQVGFFYSIKLKNILVNDFKEVDFVIYNLIRTGDYIKCFDHVINVFDMVDLLSDSYKKSYSSTTSFLHKIFYKYEIPRLERYEISLIKNTKLTFLVNEDEALSMNRYGNVKWIPNGVNSLLFSYNKFSNEFDNSIAFIGAMHYQPNIDAILWFDRYVLDHINPSIRFYIIGSKPNSQILNLANKRKNVIITGFLEDPYYILNSCNLVVSPMQNGGGIQNKILESMALGKINILTSICSKPIKGAENLIHFFVEDKPKEMACLINEICLNPLKYQQIGNMAKELIQNNFTWESYETKILRELNSLNL